MSEWLWLDHRSTKLIKQSRWKEARNTLLEMERIAPIHESTFIKIGYVNQKLKNIQGARQYYQKAIDLNPHNIDKLGMLYHQKFVDTIRIQNENTINSDLSHLTQGQTYFLNQAIKYYNAGIKLNPNNDIAYFNLGELYMRQKQYEQAKKLFKKCLLIDSKNANYCYFYGRSLLSLNQFKHASLCFNKSIMLQPNKNANHYFYLAKTLTKLKDYKAANKSFLNAIHITYHNNHAHDTEYLYHYALFCRIYLKDYETALLYANYALDIAPNHEIYQYECLKICYQQKLSLNLINQPIKYRLENRYKEVPMESIWKIMVLKTIKLVDNYLCNPPKHILALCWAYLCGEFLLDDNNAKDVRFFNDFAIQEIIQMHFDVLCPGNNDSKIMLTISKILDVLKYALPSKHWICNQCKLVNSTSTELCLKCSTSNKGLSDITTFEADYQFSYYYMRYLLIFLNLTNNIYDKLHKINNEFEDHYIEQIVVFPSRLIKFNHISYHLGIKLYVKLFDDNKRFYEKYVESIKNNSILREQMDYILKYEISQLSLRHIRKIVCPLLFKNEMLFDTTEDILIVINKLGKFMTKTKTRFFVSAWWLQLELEFLDKGVIMSNNYDTHLLLNQALYYICIAYIDSNCLSKSQFFYLPSTVFCHILKVFTIKHAINLKPDGVSWNAFYNIIDCLCLKDRTIELFLLNYFNQQIKIGVGNKDQWTECSKKCIHWKHWKQNKYSQILISL